MSPRKRKAVLAALLAAGAALAAALGAARVGTPFAASWAPAFERLGAPAQALDHALGRALPVGDVEERELGRAIHARYARGLDPGDPDQRYLDEVLAGLVPYTGKPFAYRAYAVDGGAPNALALAGGAIVVTRGLLAALGSESELAAVLAHELAHVEQGHCFDAVKFRLLGDKLGAQPIGRLADAAVQALIGHAFSKAQEAAADEYAFALLGESDYDPRSLANAFASLPARRGRTPRGGRAGDPLRDYFSSHPPLEIRAAEFGARAGVFWSRRAGERRYVGRENLLRRRSYNAGFRPRDEWATSRSVSALR